MRILNHIDKISWSIADKALFMLYGVLSIVQMNLLLPSEYGLYFLLISLHTWIFFVAEAFALNNIIQFGIDKSNTLRVNTISLLLFILIVMGSAGTIFFLRNNFAALFSEAKLVEVAYYLPILAVVTIPRVFCLKFIYRDQEMRNLFLINLAWFGTMALATAYFIWQFGNLDYYDMVNINIIGFSASSIFAVLITFRKLRFGLKGNIKPSRMLSFGFQLALTNALHAMPKLLDVYIVQFFFSTAAVGLYSSAKTLFRVFEETINAARGLIYPSAVRHYQNKNYSDLKELMTKSVSFLLIAFIIAVFALEIGLGKWMIETFLPQKYFLAVPMFSWLLLAALPMPFMILATVMTAAEKQKTVLVFVAVSLLLSLSAFYIIGHFGDANLIPVGYAVYIAALGILCFIYVNRKYQFRIVDLLKSFYDAYPAVLSFFTKNKRP